jgi:hypothetical protein
MLVIRQKGWIPDDSRGEIEEHDGSESCSTKGEEGMRALLAPR